MFSFNREINAGLADNGLPAKLADLGLTPIVARADPSQPLASKVGTNSDRQVW
jgi:hypothetical protein